MYSVSQESHEGIARYLNLHPDTLPTATLAHRAKRRATVIQSLTGDTLTPTVYTLTQALNRAPPIIGISQALNLVPEIIPPEDWQDNRPPEWTTHDTPLIQAAKGLTFHNYHIRYPHSYNLTPTTRRYYADLCLRFSMETPNNRGGQTTLVGTFLEAFGQSLVLPIYLWEEYRNGT